jgi:hypothetical protein
MTHKAEPKGLVGHVKRSFARESFPPKWLLVVAILAVIAGLSLANYRITSAEAQLTGLARGVDEACGDNRPVFRDSKDVCKDAAEVAGGTAPVAPLGQPVQGKDGRGIADLECVIQPNGNGYWKVTYTDDAVDTNGGYCYIAPNPE